MRRPRIRTQKPQTAKTADCATYSRVIPIPQSGRGICCTLMEKYMKQILRFAQDDKGEAQDGMRTVAIITAMPGCYWRVI